MEKQVLGFRAASEHRLLLISKCFQVFNFVLLLNNIDLSIPYSMVKQVLGFCAAIKHKLLLLSKCF